MNRQTDGEQVFFQNWAITLQKPDLPQSVLDAKTEKKAAVERAQAKEAEATQGQMPDVFQDFSF